MDALTILQAAETTGWSPRMLRYIERIGLVEADRSRGGYRLYGPAQLQRLRTLRELLQSFDIGLSDVGFAARLRHDERLRQALEQWFEAKPHRPDDVPAAEWLRWEQDKHQRLLGGGQNDPYQHDQHQHDQHQNDTSQTGARHTAADADETVTQETVKETA
jgi:DNA-binding transcriptional MerR regulator